MPDHQGAAGGIDHRRFNAVADAAHVNRSDAGGAIVACIDCHAVDVGVGKHASGKPSQRARRSDTPNRGVFEIIPIYSKLGPRGLSHLAIETHLSVVHLFKMGMVSPQGDSWESVEVSHAL